MPKLCKKKSAKNHPKLYPKKVHSKDTRLNQRLPMAFLDFKTEFKKRGGKSFLANIYNMNPENDVGNAIPPHHKDKNMDHGVWFSRLKHHGNCPKCLLPNCGECKYCLHMVAFGVTGLAG